MILICNFKILFSTFNSKVKLVRRCHRTIENYYIQTAIGGNPINLFTKDMPMGKKWNVYRAIIFKGIEDLPIGKITIKPFFGHWDHSNVYKKKGVKYQRQDLYLYPVATSVESISTKYQNRESYITEWSFLGTKITKLIRMK